MHADAIQKLSALAHLLHRALPAPMEAGGFATEPFIASLDPATPAACDRVTLERLSRKAEVARKLYRSYQPDLSKPASQEPARPEFALYLAVYYLHAGCALGDWKWINTGVKMTEGIVEVPVLQVPEAVKDAVAGILAGAVS